jgi:hypothetical protein
MLSLPAHSTTRAHKHTVRPVLGCRQLSKPHEVLPALGRQPRVWARAGVRLQCQAALEEKVQKLQCVHKWRQVVAGCGRGINTGTDGQLPQLPQPTALHTSAIGTCGSSGLGPASRILMAIWKLSMSLWRSNRPRHV